MKVFTYTALAALAVSGCLGQVVASHDANQVSSGYVFYAPTASRTSYLLRSDGTIAHTWPGSGPAGVSVKLLPGGSILRTGTVQTTVFHKGLGVGGSVEIRSWNGELLWHYTLPSPEMYIQHHDVNMLPNGNILINAWERRSAFEALAAGRDPATIPPEGIWSEAIFEVRPEPPTGGTIVWGWHVSDHLVQDLNPSAPNFGSIRENYRRIDINYAGLNGNPAADPDWLHFNSVSYNEKLDQILLSVRSWSEIWVIDHSTTTAEAASRGGGKYKQGGDLLYRWGNPRAYGAGTAADQRLFAQHDAQWIDEDLPGAGHMLVFNNGVGRGYSSADELVAPMNADGTYSLGAGGRFGPAAPVWSFGANAGRNFYSFAAGGAQRLRNGNTMLCLSSANRVVEATADGKIVWDLNLGAGAAGGFSFRANRFPADAAELAASPFAGRAPKIRNAARVSATVLAPGTLAAAQGGNFPARPTVSVTDSAGRTHAATAQVSVAELRFPVPAQTATGPARVTVSGEGEAPQTRDILVTRIEPTLFSANGDGEGVGAVIAIIERPEGRTLHSAYQLDPVSREYVPEAIPLSGTVYLTLFATGWVDGGEAPRVTIGGEAVPVLFAGELPQFPGVIQLNVGPVPDVLKGRQNQEVVVVKDGVASNAVELSFR